MTLSVIFEYYDAVVICCIAIAPKGGAHHGKVNPDICHHVMMS